MSRYRPPFTISSDIVTRVAEIGEMLGRVETRLDREDPLRLRRINRIRTVTGSLAIEGNTLSEAQITAILDGKHVIAPPREIQEARNALIAYERLSTWDPLSETDLLEAHQQLMRGLLDSAGSYRQSGVGIMAGTQLMQMAPPASQLPRLMADLFEWLGATTDHPLIASSVFHYEFEFIHPFADGNGRIGRLWQTLLLSQWRPLFAHLPVESLIHRQQAAYYQAIRVSTELTDSAPFISFMLEMIEDALRENLTPQVSPQVAPQVAALLSVLHGDMSREQLQAALGLADRKSFQKRHLQPALEGGWIERTLPDKPQSRLQKYRKTSQGALLAAEVLRLDQKSG